MMVLVMLMFIGLQIPASCSNSSAETVTQTPVHERTMTTTEPSIPLVTLASEYTGFYGYGYTEYSSQADIDEFMLNETVQNFLSGFKSEFERDVILQQLRHCPYTDLCRFSLGLDPPGYQSTSCCQVCSCIFPSCMDNKTCCPDIIFDNTDSMNSIYGVAHEDNMHRECISLSLSKMIGYTLGYAACPRYTNDELHNNCTRPYTADILMHLRLSDTVPVMSRVTLDIYRNRYCAYCNSLTEDQFDTLPTRLSCYYDMFFETEEDIMRTIFTDGVCDATFDGLDNCVPEVTECNATGLWHEYDANITRACSLYRSVVTIDDADLPADKKIFQNIFCSMCNGVVPDVTCMVYSHSPVSPFSFSVLLKLDTGNLDSSYTASGECSNKQLYDIISKTCKDLVCSVFMSLHHGQCIDKFEEIATVTYAVFLRVKPMETISISESNIIADDVLSYTRNFTGNTLPVCGMQMLYTSNMIFNITELILGVSSIENSSLLFFDVRIQYHLSEYHIPKDIIENLMRFHDLEHAFLVSYSNKTVAFKYEVRSGDPTQFDDISLQSEEFYDDSYKIYTIPLFFLISEYASVTSDNLTIFPHLKGNDYIGYCYEEKSEYDILWLTPCPKVKISKLDIPWNVTEAGITIENGDYIFKSNEYYHVDETHIMVCSNKYEEFMLLVMSHTVDSLSVEAMISIACSSLSILSLFLTLTIFCIFSKLRRTIPGKNNISLVSALLCAQVMYLISSISGLEKNSTECMIFGICVHFFWLVAMFWMNICTFHMFRVLAHTKAMSHSSGLKKVIMYHVYAIIMATIFVSINISVSYDNSGDIGYGGDVCYISSQEMVIYTFGVPTAFVVASNLCMFTFVIIKIKKSPSVQKNVQNERNDLIVFAKLSTITGATWIFGFLYTFTNVTAMSYLFIILNAGQGLFIMLAFVINKRVYDMFRSQMLGLTLTSESGPPTSRSLVYTTK